MRHRNLWLVLAGLLLLMVWWGSQPTAPWRTGVQPGFSHDDSPVQTDALTYRLVRQAGHYEARAVARYTNRTGAAVHYARCRRDSTGPIFWIVRAEPDQDPGHFVGSPWACVGGVPTGTLAPGATLEVEVWLGSTESPAANPPITMADRTGLFRILLELCTSPQKESDDCVPVPDAQRRSNPFRILPPDQ